MGPRAQGTEGLRRAGDYIRAHLRACGATVRDITTTAKATHDPTPRTFTSIAGTLGGREGAWILLGTHHDTRSWADEDPDPARRAQPIEGANDGTSGVAVLLEVATVLRDHPADVGVELVFFDGEEWGKPRSGDYFVGSRDIGRRFGALYPGPRPALALILDMVGDADLRYEREVLSDRAARWLNDRIWEVGRQRYPYAFAESGSLVVHDDHVALIEAGVPAALLIDFEYPPWHTVSDTLDRCSRASLAVTGRVLLEALLDRPLPGPAPPPPPG
jgi:Zn-dependent M28 family amino/carboxypeptidase